MKAYKAIFDIVKGEVDDVVLELAFSRSKHGFLLDQKGINLIKKISADTNVRILIPKEHSQHSASLEGVCENVYNALNMISKSYDEYFSQKKNSSQSSEKIPPNPVVNKPHETNRDDDKGVKRNQQISKSSGQLSIPAPPPPTKMTSKPEKPSQGPPIPPPTQLLISPTLKQETLKVERKKDFEKVEVIKMIEIPASIVGMLLINQKKDRKERTKSVINRIQMYTQTRISRLNVPPEKEAKLDADKAIKVSSDVPSVEGLNLNDNTKNTDEDTSRRRRIAESDDDEEEGEEDNEEDDEDEVIFIIIINIIIIIIIKLFRMKMMMKKMMTMRGMLMIVLKLMKSINLKVDRSINLRVI